jgi:hypothetical protein
VFAFGVVSLLTDVSSEAVAAVLPLYIAVVLGMGPLAFGEVRSTAGRRDRSIETSGASPSPTTTTPSTQLRPANNNLADAWLA